jgi:hypothetical protein
MRMNEERSHVLSTDPYKALTSALTLACAKSTPGIVVVCVGKLEHTPSGSASKLYV